MKHVTWCLAFLILATGCKTHPHPANGVDQAHVQLSQGYALLYGVAGKNDDVDKILILKKVSPESKQTVQAIAAACGDAAKRLKEFATLDPALDLSRSGLPPAEEATRNATEAATRKDLLFGSGSFELKLLLTQAESCNYITYLAASLAKEDRNDDRRKYLEELSKRFAELRQGVVGRLAVK